MEKLGFAKKERFFIVMDKIEDLLTKIFWEEFRIQCCVTRPIENVKTVVLLKEADVRKVVRNLLIKQKLKFEE